MDNESLDQIERQLASVRSVGAPAALRGEVLSEVRRELRAARWDRRMARAAAVLLVMGVGLNVVNGLAFTARDDRHVAGRGPRESLVQVAVSVAEATDAETGRMLARQLASRSGRPLSSDQAAAIDAAVERRLDRPMRNGGDG